MFLRVFMHTYGVIQLGHRERERAPMGAYDEDYHYYSYEEQPGGDYIEYKIVVSKNGTKRSVLHEEIDAEEYFKRKLAGTLKDDKLFLNTGVIHLDGMDDWLQPMVKAFKNGDV